MNSELLRIIDAIHLEKDIPKDLIFTTIESAMVAAIQKAVEPKLGKDVPIRCTLDRSTGQLSVTSDVDTGAIDLGRIAAQTAKQVIIQSLRDAENAARHAPHCRFAEIDQPLAMMPRQPGPDGTRQTIAALRVRQKHAGQYDGQYELHHAQPDGGRGRQQGPGDFLQLRFELMNRGAEVAGGQVPELMKRRSNQGPGGDFLRRRRNPQRSILQLAG